MTRSSEGIPLKVSRTGHEAVKYGGRVYGENQLEFMDRLLAYFFSNNVEEI